jgi:peptidylprolyl isomerase
VRRPTTARTALRAAAAVLALSLTLAACSGEAGDDPTTPAPTDAAATPAPDATATAEDVAALEAVVVEGAVGAQPTVTLPSTPFTVSAPVARVLDDGTGEEIASGDMIDLDSVWVKGTDGSVENSTWEKGTPEQIVVSDSQLVSVISDLLVGNKVGMRFAFAVPAGEETAVAVGEVVGKRPSRAVGTPVEPAAGLPAVTLDDTGKPSIEPVDGDAPTDLVVQPLIEGDGPAVESGQTITVQYSGWLWDGTPFDSSWERGTPAAFGIGVQQVITGWDEGLVGQKVGSQVLLVVPPDKAYGDTPKETIPAGSTLVFVVDVLAAS